MKKLLKALLISVLLLSMVGCSSSSDETVKFHVGVVQLTQHDALDAATNGFVDTLKEEYGDAIEIDVKNASGDSALCSTIASGFVNENVDLIMANATPALQASASATNTIPILGTAVTEYGIALDIDNFTGTTGTNISGTSDLANLEEQAQMILDLIPSAKTVGILYCSSEANSVYQVGVVKDYLTKKGITVKEYAFTESNDISLVVGECCNNVDAIYIPTDNKCADCADTIDGVARPAGIPIICGEESTASKCGVATQTISYYELGVITGKMAIKILNGEADVSTMPIEYYSDYYTEAKKYNKQICSDLGIEIPSDYEEIE